MLKSKIKSLENKSEQDFEVISDKSAAEVVGGDCAMLEKCTTFTGDCSSLKSCGTFRNEFLAM